MTRGTSDPEQKEMLIRLEHLVGMKAGANPGQKARMLRIVELLGAHPLAYSLDVTNYGKDRQYGETNILDLATTDRVTAALNDKYGASETPHIVTSSKHGNNVVTAKGETQLQAYKRAMAADAQSPFGGFFQFNRPLEQETAAFIRDLFIEGVIAPDFDPAAIKILAEQGENRFILKRRIHTLAELGNLKYTVVGNDLMEQERLNTAFDLATQGCVVAGHDNPYPSSLSKRALAAAQFGVDLLGLITSNTVLFSTAHASIGIGNGVGNRYQAARNARANFEASLYHPMAFEDATHAQRALFETPYTIADFEDLREEVENLVFAGCSDAFYPAVDAFIETLGIDRFIKDFEGGKVQINYKTSRNEDKSVNVLLPKANYDQNKPEAAMLVPDVIVQPGICDGDARNRALADKYGIPMVFMVEPKAYEAYMSARAKGEKPSLAGKRFFEHGVWN